ncbi:GNAT family N-acetyltransferase [Novosphingobium humi]|uniref:GNAT family N-acetyltransferase n=1 Tax=Novosphingobium humi TaxID=2282397 RepID=A0ABY7TY25_9SPHN|nr:GNAT family N-acetyltransferase [Novosphingobium humi]WCT78172.1 GNAT family N-acetyltransferase [Novosphingobium humi]
MTRISYHANLNELQGDYALGALLRAPVAPGPFDRLEWFAGLAELGGMRPMVGVARDGDGVAVLPLAHRADGPKSDELGPLANWYAFTVRPRISAGADGLGLLTALARDLRGRTGRVTLWPVPDEDGEAGLLEAAFARAGWIVERAPCDTNHFLRLNGRSYADYLAARPGALRTTLKRKAKKVSITLYDYFSDAAWDDYETVYAQSWKPEEGSPALLRRFAQEEGAAGRLRMGVAHGEIEGVNQPVAAQMWTVENGTAYIHKLAYVEAAKPISPGTSLSAALFERVIESDHVHTVDFGTGDDPYKRDWMEESRPRYRITAYHPLRPGQWGAIAKSLLRRLLDRPG